MIYLKAGLFEIWDYEDIKGIELLPVSIGAHTSSLFHIQFQNYYGPWQLLSFDLTYFQGCVTLIDITVDKLIDYCIWKTLQF
jgi:hypothetical protein